MDCKHEISINLTFRCTMIIRRDNKREMNCWRPIDNTFEMIIEFIRILLQATEGILRPNFRITGRCDGCLRPAFIMFRDSNIGGQCFVRRNEAGSETVDEENQEGQLWSSKVHQPSGSRKRPRSVQPLDGNLRCWGEKRGSVRPQLLEGESVLCL